MPHPIRPLVPVAMLAAAALAVRRADDPYPWTAYAEYLVARDATAKARQSAFRANALVERIRPADQGASDDVIEALLDGRWFNY